MEKNQIKAIEEEFAVFMLIHESINYQKYCSMCDKNCKNKSGGKH